MGRVNKLVSAALVPEPAVVLHQLADDRALRVPNGESTAQRTREAQQVKLGCKLAMIAFRRFFELVEMRGQRLLRFPGGSVDPLQHRALFVATPVGARHLLQFEESQLAGGGNVRAHTHVDELVGIAVGADCSSIANLAGVFGVSIGAVDTVDDLNLVRLIGK